MRNLLLTFEKVFTHLAMLSTSLMVVLMTLDAGSRYCLKGGGIAGIYEMVEQYLMPTVVFLGVCYTYRKGGYIRVTFLMDSLPRKIKAALEYIDHLFSIVLSVIFVITTVLKALRIFEKNVRLENWPLPLWPAYVIVPVGFTLATLVMLLDLKLIKARKSGLLSEESPNV